MLRHTWRWQEDTPSSQVVKGLGRSRWWHSWEAVLSQAQPGAPSCLSGSSGRSLFCVGLWASPWFPGWPYSTFQGLERSWDSDQLAESWRLIWVLPSSSFTLPGAWIPSPTLTLKRGNGALFHNFLVQRESLSGSQETTSHLLMPLNKKHNPLQASSAPSTQLTLISQPRGRNFCLHFADENTRHKGVKAHPGPAPESGRARGHIWTVCSYVTHHSSSKTCWMHSLSSPCFPPAEVKVSVRAPLGEPWKDVIWSMT